MNSKNSNYKILHYLMKNDLKIRWGILFTVTSKYDISNHLNNYVYVVVISLRHIDKYLKKKKSELK